MQITIITLFPQAFDSIFSHSILGRAQREEKIKINILDLREFGNGPHQTVDDKPYGGGVGMVLKVDVMDKAIEEARIRDPKAKEAVILLDPKGEVYSQKNAEIFSKLDHLILICGHYEGYDERIRDLVDYEISVGDYVLSGGEIGAMLITESVVRLVPEVLSKTDATNFESFSDLEGSRILEHPQYTRPESYKGKNVPEVLLSGNFKKIEEFRKEEAQKLTKKRRPDLI
ncbi:MAG TPA: tRNA (guanosine(37)-N1)-methyltransferase TrmD [Patescibacteria group bacterium]|nr:tRNA (guanosine(37)-N1)-methyltransferase TrmD [Patescibacteria group bacterium]